MIPTGVLKRFPLFRSFLTASTISLLGSNIFDLAVPLHILEKTHSVLDLSIINLAINLPYFVMAPVTGYIADHFDKRRIMLAADLGQCTCMIGLLVIEWLNPLAIWPVATLVFVAKSLMILFDTVVTFQLIPALVCERGGLSDANTWFLSSHRLIQIIGPLIGGALLTILGIQGCIAINLLSFAATFSFVFKMKELSNIIDGDQRRTMAPFPTPTRVFNSFVLSFKYIWGSALFRPFVFLMFFWNLSALCPNTPTMIYYFNEVHHYSAFQYGLISACFGIMGIFGFLSATYFYRSLKFQQTFILFSLMHTILSGAAAIMFQVPAIFSLLFSTARFGSSIVSMGTFLLRQTRVPKNIAGTVNACLRMLFMSAVPLSSIIQGGIIHRWGVGVSMIVGALCLVFMFYYTKQLAKALNAPGRRQDSREAA